MHTALVTNGHSQSFRAPALEAVETQQSGYRIVDRRGFPIRRPYDAANLLPPGITPPGMSPQVQQPPQIDQHQHSVISPQRVYLQKLTKFNALWDLTLEKLSHQIRDFGAGYLRYFALTMDAIVRADDLIQTVFNKRKGAIKRRGYEIIVKPDADETDALAHKAALQYFYDNIQVTNAVDMNQLGGWALLIDQMMEAVPYQYAVHEVIWKPGPEGITARFNYVPLWFFENRTGKLRFLIYDFAFDGIDLETIAANGWMVTCAQGLMQAGSRDFMWKNMAVKNWLIYTEKHGMPLTVIKTPSAPGTDQWNAAVNTISQIGADFGGVMNTQDELETVQMSAQGALPHPPLVDHINKMLTLLFRGSDLATLSAKDNTGASLQDEEADVVERDDACIIADTLQMQIDKKVIEWTFGEGTIPLAYCKIVVPPRKDDKTELAVTAQLVEWGCQIGKKDTMETFGRTPLRDGDEALEKAPLPQPGGFGDSGDPSDQGNEAPSSQAEQTARVALAKAYASEFSDLRDRLQAIMAIKDEGKRDEKLLALRKDLHDHLRDINKDPAAAKILEQAMVSAFFKGMKNTQANEQANGAIGSGRFPRGSSATGSTGKEAQVKHGILRPSYPTAPNAWSSIITGDSLSEQWQRQADLDGQFAEAKEQDVKLDEITGTKSMLSPSALNNYLTGKEAAPVLVVVRNGKKYLYDGHHRTQAAISRGEETIKAKVVTLIA